VHVCSDEGKLRIQNHFWFVGTAHTRIQTGNDKHVENSTRAFAVAAGKNYLSISKLDNFLQKSVKHDALSKCTTRDAILKSTDRRSRSLGQLHIAQVGNVS